MLYPPLATLEERPLHLDELPPGHKWGCQIISKHFDTVEDLSGLVEIIHFDWRCSVCVDTAAAIVKAGHNPSQEWRRLPDSEPTVVSLNWLVRRARHWLMCGECGEPGSPRDGVGACIYCGSPDGGDNALLHDPWK